MKEIRNKNKNKKNSNISPQIAPQKKYGEKLSTKVILNKGYIRTDGTVAIYLYVYLNKKKKRIPLNINIKPEHFSEKRQRIKNVISEAKDYNILIEKALSELHKIELDFRLRNKIFSLSDILQEWENPSMNIDFFKFYEIELEKEKGVIKIGTYRQQKSTLKKLRKWRKEVFFQDVDSDFIKSLVKYCKVKLKNGNATIFTTLKNVKKFLNKAKDKNISFPLNIKEIKIIRPQGRRTFLSKEEINSLYQFYNSDFINDTYKNVLRMFLFSCFTGLRFSDVAGLTLKNIADNTLFFTAEKTNKIQRIRLNKTALKFIDLDCADLFPVKFTNEHINRELKEVAKITGIKKVLTFHVARHTFASQFLLNGGSVENLQQILAHSNIRETMIYVHIVDSVTDIQIYNLDDIIS